MSRKNARNQGGHRATLMGRRDLLKASLAIGASGAAATAVAAGGDGSGRAAKRAPRVDVPRDVGPITYPRTRDLSKAVENWNEPWTWRPRDWPGQQLDLNVVESQNPNISVAVGYGNPEPIYFSYGGQTPGPTVRMRGNETLRVRLRNMLGKDHSQVVANSAGITYVGPYPDPAEILSNLDQGAIDAKAAKRGQYREDFCLGEHTNGVHSIHVTNLHTHGLHVKPDRNDDGTHSDNVILRVISQGEFQQRKDKGTEPACDWLKDNEQAYFLRDDETVGEASYEFRLGNVQGNPRQPHPPGTFWYHPHAHGATDVQVSSGMAGFLIIEGDVDDTVSLFFTGAADAPATRKSGAYDYRERLMFMQRVFPGGFGFAGADKDAETPSRRRAPTPVTNGDADPAVINMRKGAVERWRVLNGSVDGRGYKRFMLLRGEYRLGSGAPDDDPTDTRLYKLVSGSRKGGQGTAGAGAEVTAFPADEAMVEADKVDIWQMAFDGVTLLDVSDPAEPRYTIRSLKDQFFGSRSGPSPLAAPLGKDPNASLLRNIENAWKDAENVRNTWVRPNEVYLGPANRADLLVQIPRDVKGGDVFTAIGYSVLVHSDTPEQKLQGAVAKPSATAQNPATFDASIIAAYIVVPEDDPKDPGANEVESAHDPIPGVRDAVAALEVQDYVRPISDEELRVEKGQGQDAHVGQYRTRIVKYSGWGAQGYPLITNAENDPNAAAFSRYIEGEGRDLELLRYAKDESGHAVLLPPLTRTMAIDGIKFNPYFEDRPQMLLDTSEEWCVYNCAQTLWGDTDTSAYPQPGQYNNHYRAYPIDRGDGERRFNATATVGGHDGRQFQIVTRAVDHPFHIHQNPAWVTRIEVPDANGQLVNILLHPRWMDVIPIPRNCGRVVFRSRFVDYVGLFVNHCHLLIHEDNGMMEAIQITPFASQANNDFSSAPASRDATAEAVDATYPRPSNEAAWVINASFVDPNPSTGQTYPGFAVVPPTLPAARR